MVKLFQELMTINMMINKKLLLFAGLWIIATIFVFSFVKVPSDNLGGNTAKTTINKSKIKNDKLKLKVTYKEDILENSVVKECIDYSEEEFICLKEIEVMQYAYKGSAQGVKTKTKLTEKTIKVPKEKLLGAIASTTEEIATTTEPIIEEPAIEYVDEIITEEITLYEDISLRTANSFSFVDGDKIILHYYSSDIFYYDNPKWFNIVFATTTIDAYNEQVVADEILGATDITSTNNGDSDIRQGSVNLNRGSVFEFATGHHIATSNLAMRGIIQWILPSRTGTISDVSMWLRNSVGAQSVGQTNIHELSRMFVESQVTWNSYSTGNNWTTAGGDFSATIVDSSTVQTNNTWVEYVLQGTGATNPMTLDWGDTPGFIVKANTEGGNNYNDWYSKEYPSDTTLRPYLEITYTTAPPATRRILIIN